VARRVFEEFCGVNHIALRQIADPEGARRVLVDRRMSHADRPPRTPGSNCELKLVVTDGWLSAGSIRRVAIPRRWLAGRALSRSIIARRETRKCGLAAPSNLRVSHRLVHQVM